MHFSFLHVWVLNRRGDPSFLAGAAGGSHSLAADLRRIKEPGMFLGLFKRKRPAEFLSAAG